MKTLNEIRAILSEHKTELKREFRLKNLGIFGSYSREEQTQDSDVDILVELGDPLGLGFVRLAFRLEEILDMKVDLVSRGAIKPRVWKYIEKDIVYV